MQQANIQHNDLIISLSDGILSIQMIMQISLYEIAKYTIKIYSYLAIRVLEALKMNNF